MARKIDVRSGVCLASALCVVAFSSQAPAQTLEEVLGHAYAHNPTILAARETFKQTSEGKSTAWGSFRPNLSASRGYTRAITRTVEDRSSSATDTLTDTLSLSQTLFSFNNLAQLKKADHEVAAQRQRLEVSEQQILLQAITVYLDVLKEGQIVELRKNNVKVLQAHLDSTQVQYDLRRRTNADLAQARSRLARGQADLATARATADKARSRFLQVVGFQPKDLEMPQFTFALPENAAEAEKLAFSDQPAVRAADRDVDAARAEINVKTGEFAPNIALSGSVANARTDNRSTANSNTLTSTIGVTLTVPLYQSGNEYTNLRIARQALSQKLHEYDQAHRLAVDNARQAWDDVTSAEVRVKAFETQIEAAEIALQGVAAELEVGRRTLLNLLDAEQELLDAKVNMTGARRDYMVARFTLLERTGRLGGRDLGVAVATDQGQ